MEMGSAEKIDSIEPAGEIYTCPACAYKDGFHVSFNIQGDSHEGEIVLICPNCHSRFRIGWNVSLGGNY